MTEPRPHRPALDAATAAVELRAEVTAGRPGRRGLGWHPDVATVDADPWQLPLWGARPRPLDGRPQRTTWAWHTGQVTCRR